MSKKRPYFKSYFWATLIAFYVVLQFLWWGNLLIGQYKESGSPLSKTFMVVGEGSVFLILLGFGIYKLFRSIKQERELVEQKKNFLLATSHELRTPLAGIKLNLETIQQRAEQLTSEQIQQLTTSAIQENNRLQKLISNMLLVNRSVFDAITPNLEEFDVKAFIEQDAQRISKLTSGVNLHLNLTESTIKFDKGHLQSILDNLVENAVKYAGEDKPIYIENRLNNEHHELIVRDSGKGIKKKHRKKIFSPFYRIEQEETRQQKGTGLGLNIVQRLAHSNDAQIKYENDKKGSQFIISMNYE